MLPFAFSRTDFRPRHSLVAAAFILPLAGFALLIKQPSADLTIGSGTPHFYIVSAVAALALALAVSVIVAARRLPDPRTFFLAMGFVAMATIFFAHGLGTSPIFAIHATAIDGYGSAAAAPAVLATGLAPTAFDPTFGFIPGGGAAAAVTVPPDVDHTAHAQTGPAMAPASPVAEVAKARARGTVVGYSAQLSLVVSAIFFALATLDLPELLRRLVVKYWFAGIVLLSTLLAGHVYLALEAPQLLSWLPLNSGPVKWSVGSVAIGCFAFAALRYFESYRLAQLPLQAAMAFGMVLLIEAELFMLMGRIWHLSWWGYHAVMLGGFLICVVGLLKQYRVTGDLGAIVEGLFLRQQVNGLRAADPRALRALSAAVAAKDTETAGHTERVGELSVNIGRRLELPADRIEVLRVAGRLHDVGKIGVPNNILRKPGPLTAQEFEVMKLHTTRGWRLADRSEMLAHVALIIRAHHERMDGSGYPDGLRAEFIPFEARVIAVADVWDALTCDRPYRKAMEWEQAAAILEKAAGPHLDPRCVRAIFEELGLPYHNVPFLRRDAA